MGLCPTADGGWLFSSYSGGAYGSECDVTVTARGGARTVDEICRWYAYCGAPPQSLFCSDLRPSPAGGPGGGLTAQPAAPKAAPDVDSCLAPAGPPQACLDGSIRALTAARLLSPSGGELGVQAYWVHMVWKKHL